MTETKSSLSQKNQKNQSSFGGSMNTWNQLCEIFYPVIDPSKCRIDDEGVKYNGVLMSKISRLHSNPETRTSIDLYGKDGLYIVLKKTESGDESDAINSLHDSGVFSECSGLVKSYQVGISRETYYISMQPMNGTLLSIVSAVRRIKLIDKVHLFKAIVEILSCLFRKQFGYGRLHLGHILYRCHGFHEKPAITVELGDLEHVFPLQKQQRHGTPFFIPYIPLSSNKSVFDLDYQVVVIWSLLMVFLQILGLVNNEKLNDLSEIELRDEIRSLKQKVKNESVGKFLEKWLALYLDEMYSSLTFDRLERDLCTLDVDLHHRRAK